MRPGAPLESVPLPGENSPVPWALSLGHIVGVLRSSATAFTYAVERSACHPVEFTLKKNHSCVLTWNAEGSWGLDRAEFGTYGGQCSSAEERLLFDLAEQATKEAAPFRGVPVLPGTSSTEWAVHQARGIQQTSFFHTQPLTPALNELDMAVKAIASRVFSSPLRVLRGEATLSPSGSPASLVLEVTLRSVGTEPLLMADPRVASNPDPSGITLMNTTRDSIWQAKPTDVTLLSSPLDSVANGIVRLRTGDSVSLRVNAQGLQARSAREVTVRYTSAVAPQWRSHALAGWMNFGTNTTFPDVSNK